MEKKKRREGRPSKLDNPEVIEQAGTLCRLFGATDEQLSQVFKVDVDTISNWKKAKPEFFKAIKDGKEEWDTRIERSLAERAMGYSYKTEKLFFDRQTGQVIREPFVEHCPPDPTSMIFWLKNRKPKEWRDRREITQDGPAPTLQVQFVDAPKQESMAEWLKRRQTDDKPTT